MPSYNYLDIVSQSISDFNAIFNALANKSVAWDATTDKDSNTKFPSTATGSGTLGVGSYTINGGISTADYAKLINYQLFRISGVNSATAPAGVTNGVLSSYAGSEVLATDATIGDDGITITVPQAGYYTTGSHIQLSSLTNISTSGTLSGSTPAVSSGLTLTTNASGNYEVKAADNKLLTSLTVDKGSVVITQGDVDLSGVTATPSAVIKGGSDTDVTGATLTSSKTSEKYAITIDTNATLGGTVSVTAGNTITAGYVTELSNTSVLTKSKKFGADAGDQSPTGGSVSYVINLDKASISGIKGSAGIGTVTGAGIVNAIPEGKQLSDYYTIEITPTATVDLSTLSITEGYIKADDTSNVTFDSKNTTLTPKSVYLAKGSVANFTANDAAPTVSGVANGLINAVAANGKYTLTASVDKSGTGTITTGYVSDTSYNVAVTGSTDVIINQGSVANTAVSNSLNITDNSSALSGSASDGTPVIGITARSSVTPGAVTEGYVKGIAEVPTTNAEPTTDTKYLKPGSAVVTPTITSTFHNVNKTDIDPGDPADDNIGSILLKTAPNDKDYFEVTAAASTTSLTAGWFKDTDRINVATPAAAKYYIPQAVVEWVQDQEHAGEEYLQVTSGGYLPSGILEDIAQVTPNYASLALSYTNNFADSVNGNYTITVSRNASGTNAGYISATQGTLTDYTVSVAHGTVDVSEGTKTITVSETPTWNATSSKYDFDATGSAVVNVAVSTPGYTKQADITGLDTNQSYKTVESTGTLSLNKATLTVDSSTTVSVIGGNGGTVALDGTGTSAYYVKPTIDPSHDSVSATGTAGYLSASDFGNLELNITNNSEDKIYIKAGTPLTNVTGTDSTQALTGALEADKKYKVSLASYNIPVTGTLAEGYYKDATETSVSGTATVTAKDYEIDPAAASVGLAENGATNTITATGATLLTTKVAGKEYVEINADASATFAVSSVTPGYLSEIAQITVGSANNIGADTKYIEKYIAGNATVGQETAVDPATVTANASKTLNTAGKYVANDIAVTLTSDAMGVNVAAQLDHLAKRLAGTYTVTA